MFGQVVLQRRSALNRYCRYKTFTSSMVLLIFAGVILAVIKPAEAVLNPNGKNVCNREERCDNVNLSYC